MYPLGADAESQIPGLILEKLTHSQKSQKRAHPPINHTCALKLEEKLEKRS